MYGVDLNKQIFYIHASLRFFNEGECHVSRFCRDDVLLLVYEGILRFTENGRPYEIHAGEYFIQQHDGFQEGPVPSGTPKYLYVHFSADWAEGENVLPKSGVFDYSILKEHIEEMDALACGDTPYIIKAAKFYQLLSGLYKVKPAHSAARRIAEYISGKWNEEIRLDALCREFNFSKNHIINIFKKEWGMTPVSYLNYIRLSKAEHLMEVTSDTLENIALQCGFFNYSHFYRLFMRRNGLSPEKWRERRRIG